MLDVWCLVLFVTLVFLSCSKQKRCQNSNLLKVVGMVLSDASPCGLHFKYVSTV